MKCSLKGKSEGTLSRRHAAKILRKLLANKERNGLCCVAGDHSLHWSNTQWLLLLSPGPGLKARLFWCGSGVPTPASTLRVLSVGERFTGFLVLRLQLGTHGGEGTLCRVFYPRCSGSGQRGGSPPCGYCWIPGIRLPLLPEAPSRRWTPRRASHLRTVTPKRAKKNPPKP